jgi:hypothetical protein
MRYKNEPMSRKLTSKCDGCGVEHVDEDGIGIAPILGAGRRRGTDRWGSLTVASSAFPAIFDLCEACTKRIVDLLELEVPDTHAIVQRYGGLGGHAMPFMPGDFMAQPSAPPWTGPLRGALTPEDLKALGIDIPGFPPPSTPSTCSNCGVAYKGPRPTTCTMCGHAHD